VRASIEKSGSCLRCSHTTSWEIAEGWVFHTTAKHWRCSVCRCATEPHLYLSPDIVEKLRREEAQRLLDRED